MVKSEFRRVAEKHNCKLQVSDNNIAIGMGVRSPRVIYRLICDYKSSEIIIDNKTGFEFVGNVSCWFKPTHNSLSLNLSTKTHINRIFSRAKNPFKIDVNNYSLDTFLKNSSALKSLETIAKTTKFEPQIIGSNNNGCYHLKTTYHLQFKNWEQALDPLLLFYKDFIDNFSVNT